MDDDSHTTDPRSGSIDGFIAGLSILAAYMKNGAATKYAFGAEHDTIHIWGDVDLEKLPEDSDDGRMLIALGFHTDEELDQWQYYT